MSIRQLMLLTLQSQVLQKNVAITVTDDLSDNVDIVISGSETVSVQENQTSVSTYSANETVTWSLSGTDSSLFSISNSGVLTFSSAPDYEATLMMEQTMNII